MVPTIRVDDQVYAWLQSQAKPFEDTPNSVLRRLAGLAAPRDRNSVWQHANAQPSRADRQPAPRSRQSAAGAITGRITGRKMAEACGLSVSHALYARGGKFYIAIFDNIGSCS